jgi:c(7)-type cytochrome triheme protein
MQKVTKPQDAAGESERVQALRRISTPERLALVAVVCCCLSVILFNIKDSAAAPNEITAREPKSLKSAIEEPTPDYSKFSHKSPIAHEAFAKAENCGTCHRRKDSSLEPKFPAHKDCIGCHLVEFTASSLTASVNPICTICHTAEGLNSSNASTKGFPRLRSFMAKFDHTQHLKGIESARPATSCAACHASENRGIAISIPSRLNAHQICYDCHSEGKSASSLSSCDSCHKFGPYSPTSIVARAYRVGFSHADHGPRQRLNCESCHNVLSRGLPQARQVTSIAPALHHSGARTRSCMTCHNGRRAFGDAKAEFDNCKRCHKGTTFKS